MTMTAQCGLKLIAPPCASSRASSRGLQPESLSGSIEVFLSEPGTVNELDVFLIGHVHGRLASKDVMASKEISKMTKQVAHKKKLDAGLHTLKWTFPIWLNMPPSSPVKTNPAFRGFAVEYELIAKATITFSKKDKRDCETRTPIEILLDHECAGQDYTVPVRTKGGRAPLLQYELSLPHRSWAAGTTVKARLAMQQVDSRSKLKSMSTVLIQSVAAKLKGGDCTFRHEIANTATEEAGSDGQALVPGDRLIELTIPTTCLLSIDNEMRGIKISHTFVFRLQFIDHVGKVIDLTNTLPITVISANQAADAQRASQGSEAWMFGNAGQGVNPGFSGYPIWPPSGPQVMGQYQQMIYQQPGYPVQYQQPVYGQPYAPYPQQFLQQPQMTQPVPPPQPNGPPGYHTAASPPLAQFQAAPYSTAPSGVPTPQPAMPPPMQAESSGEFTTVPSPPQPPSHIHPGFPPVPAESERKGQWLDLTYLQNFPTQPQQPIQPPHTER
ncbi:hypothetical protein BKA62DRAFT_686251 [Auriculariales sp. MPI-PUGE-AT-0066]|nr:hypothetical protein BKA62DRAFT_686251 [Auriculariales sp. MPI-PUGE-AT-0066]